MPSTIPMPASWATATLGDLNSLTFAASPPPNYADTLPPTPLSLDTVVRTYLGKSTKGDIGIELEAEGNLGIINSTYWKSEADGSLRNGGMEYVLKKPVAFESLPNALDEFVAASSAFKFNKSLRTSCHVHVNVQPFTFREVYAVIGAYWLFEDILVEHCGPDRVSNLFCLRASDAQAQVSSVIRTMSDTLRNWESQFLLDFTVDNAKYSALNLACLRTFGSIEFRSMRGIYTKNEIQLWTSILWKLVSVARADGSVIKVYDLFKQLTPTELLTHYFGEYAGVLKRILGWEDAIKKSSMFLAQLAFVENRANKGEFKRPEYKEVRRSRSKSINFASPNPSSGFSLLIRDLEASLLNPEGEGTPNPTNYTTLHYDYSIHGDY